MCVHLRLQLVLTPLDLDVPAHDLLLEPLDLLERLEHLGRLGVEPVGQLGLLVGQVLHLGHEVVLLLVHVGQLALKVVPVAAGNDHLLLAHRVLHDHGLFVFGRRYHLLVELCIRHIQLA